MTTATWLAAVVLAVGSVSVFWAFLRDLPKVLQDADEHEGHDGRGSDE